MYHIFFICSYVDGHLGCFYVLAILGCMYPFKSCFYPDTCLGVGLLNHVEALFQWLANSVPQQLIQLNNKTINNPTGKQAEDLNRDISKEEI